eukprot:g75428.t1
MEEDKKKEMLDRMDPGKTSPEDRDKDWAENPWTPLILPVLAVLYRVRVHLFTLQFTGSKKDKVEAVFDPSFAKLDTLFVDRPVVRLVFNGTHYDSVRPFSEAAVVKEFGKRWDRALVLVTQLQKRWTKLGEYCLKRCSIFRKYGVLRLAPWGNLVGQELHLRPAAFLHVMANNKSQQGPYLEAVMDLNEQVDYKIHFNPDKPKDDEPLRKEKKAFYDSVMNYAKFRQPGDFFKPWIIPSPNEQHACTTKRTEVKYGQAFHVKVSFMTREEAQLAAFRFIEHLRPEGKIPIDDADLLKEAQRLWEGITGVKFDQVAAQDDNLGSAPPFQDEKDSDSEEEMKQEEADKIPFQSMRRQMTKTKHWTTQKAEENKNTLFVRDITLYCPCDVVAGGGSLLDLPGLNDNAVNQQATDLTVPKVDICGFS